MDITLPKEMWYKIWSDLDFDNLQKTCVLVCQGWFRDIRGDGRLSGQLSLKNAEMEEEEAKVILSKWKELRILRLSKNLDPVDLSKTHMFLKKVIVPNVPEGYQNMFLDFLEDPEVSVNKICFDPHDTSNSVGLDNITELTLHFGELGAIEESEKPYEPMGVMKNLIRLEIIFGEGNLEEDDFDFGSIIEPLFQGIGFSSDLEEVRLEAKGDFFQICGDLILKYLSQITRLEIVGIHQGDFHGYSKDLLWIPKLKNLKTLVVYDLNIKSESDDEGNVPFYKTPMAKLTTLELCGSVIGPVICDPGKELQKFNVKKMQASFQQELFQKGVMLLTEKRLHCRSNDMITAMTEAAIFTIGRSRIIGYGKIRPVLFVGLPNSIKSSNHFLTKPRENLS